MHPLLPAEDPAGMVAGYLPKAEHAQMPEDVKEGQMLEGFWFRDVVFEKDHSLAFFLFSLLFFFSFLHHGYK